MSVYKEIIHIDPVGYTSQFAVDANGEHAFFGANKSVIIQIQGTGTIEVYTSVQKQKVNFLVASSATNMYSVCTLADEALTVNPIVLSLTVAGSTAKAEINSNLFTWFAVKATSGTPAIKIIITDNQ